MTKLHETFYRGNLKNFEVLKTGIKGELTVVLSKKEERYNFKKNDFNKKKISIEINDYLKRYSLKDVAKLVSEKYKLPKKQIYDLCLKIKK